MCSPSRRRSRWPRPPASEASPIGAWGASPRWPAGRSSRWCDRTSPSSRQHLAGSGQTRYKARMLDTFKTRGSLQVGGKSYNLYRLSALTKDRAALDRLPFSLKILLENLVRNEDDRTVRRDDIEWFLSYDPKQVPDREIAFRPARVLLQDFTGVPAVVDLAAMRDAIARMGGDPRKIEPLVPMDLVIDHSVSVDHYASKDALSLNTQLEFQRNRERYQLLRWGQ